MNDSMGGLNQGQEWKRSGQIPEFGQWEYANELPITQYFESARQAGLVRYSSSSSSVQTHHHHNHKVKQEEMRNSREKGRRKQKQKQQQQQQQGGKVKVCDVTEQGMRRKHENPLSRPPKPVDEDLYKIPPELLRTTKRKKMLAFISNCLAPAACVS